MNGLAASSGLTTNALRLNRCESCRAHVDIELLTIKYPFQSVLQFMHFFRRLIALLLIVALPAYTWAAPGQPSLCAGSAPPAVAVAQAASACCHMAGAAQEDGSYRPAKSTPCKAGDQCRTASPFYLQLPRTAAIPSAPSILVAGTESPLLSQDPAGIWRPPRTFFL